MHVSLIVRKFRAPKHNSVFGIERIALTLSQFISIPQNEGINEKAAYSVGGEY